MKYIALGRGLLALPLVMGSLNDRPWMSAP